MTRIVSPEPQVTETTDRALRPQTLAEFVGQPQAKGNLSVFIEAAKNRQEALDHVLLFGPPGLGKTTLAQIIARVLGVNFRATSGPVLAKAGDLAAILTNLEPNDVLFIDEIHRLAANVEEILYPAMEDHVLDLIIGEGPSARSLARLEVDEAGLDSLDRRYLRALIENYSGGPAGVETLAYAIAEARDAVEDVIEPFLMQQGFIQRTPRGRMACAKAYLHIGLTPPPQPKGQPGLFEE